MATAADEIDAHGVALESCLAARDSAGVQVILYGSTANTSLRRLTARTTRLFEAGLRVGAIGTYVLRESIAALTLRFDRPDLLEELLQATLACGRPIRIQDLLTRWDVGPDTPAAACLVEAILERPQGGSTAASLSRYRSFVEIALRTCPNSAALNKLRSDPFTAPVIMESEMRLALRAAPIVTNSVALPRRSKLA